MGGQGRIGDYAAAPHPREEIVLGDDAFAVLHQIGQEVEDLRLNLDCNVASPQLARVCVKYMIIKQKPHSLGPRKTARVSIKNQAYLGQKQRASQSLCLVPPLTGARSPAGAGPQPV